MMRRVLALVILVAWSLAAPTSSADDGDPAASDVEKSDYFLSFTVPAGLMPGATHSFMAERAHSAVTAALIEWINNATFDGAAAGRFIVGTDGVTRRR